MADNGSEQSSSEPIKYLIKDISKSKVVEHTDEEYDWLCEQEGQPKRHIPVELSADQIWQEHFANAPLVEEPTKLTDLELMTHEMCLLEIGQPPLNPKLLKSLPPKFDDPIYQQPAASKSAKQTSPAKIQWQPFVPEGILLVKKYVEEVDDDIVDVSRPEPINDQFDVDGICALGIKKDEDGVWDQVVVNAKWKGYPYDENTWESLGNIHDDSLPETRSKMEEDALEAAPVSEDMGKGKGKRKEA